MNVNDIKTIAVIGAGNMGHGIAEVALLTGYRVNLYDIKQEYLDRGYKSIKNSLSKLKDKAKITAEVEKQILNHLLHLELDLKRAVEDADVVIEAIPEIIDIKKSLFKKLSMYTKQHAILASNTSNMSITELSEQTTKPDKVAGMHFFNPAVLMRLVEVIKGSHTSNQTMEILYELAIKWNKVPVRVEKDIPGFIVNRVQAPRNVLIQSILDANLATPEELDALFLKDGRPMGPLETSDIVGLDVNYNSAVYRSEVLHPDYAPSRTLKEKYEKGELGKKTGKGYYDWSNGRPNIDLLKATDKFDELDFIAVILNEATKLIENGVATSEDIDKAVVYGTGNKKGPFALARAIDCETIKLRLEKLSKMFNKEIFKPTNMIKEGLYLTK